jgi:hypothetical protein
MSATSKNYRGHPDTKKIANACEATGKKSPGAGQDHSYGDIAGIGKATKRKPKSY